MRRFLQALIWIPLGLVHLVCGGCSDAADEIIDRLGADDIAGAYTGVMQGVSVQGDEMEASVRIAFDLIHPVSVRRSDVFVVTIESDVIPRFRALVVGNDEVKINLDFVAFDGFLPGDPTIDGIEVKQVVFVRHEGEWVLVLQWSRVGVDPELPTGTHVYQFASYPSDVVEEMSEIEALEYLEFVISISIGNP